MECGLTTPPMAICGCQLLKPALAPTVAAGIGFTAIGAGPGYQTTRGDGRHFIMADGITIRFMATHGYPVMIGDPLGWVGDIATGTTAGLR